MRTSKMIGVVLGLIIVVGVAACGPGAQTPTPESSIEAEPERAGGRLVYGLTLAPSGIDPHVNASSELGIPLNSVYDTLVYRKPGAGNAEMQQFVPGLAESWEISQDGLTYTFHLRQDVVFHDGTPFDAEAVRVNIERVMSTDIMSQKAVFLLGPVSAVEVLDQHTVALQLSEPYAALLDGLAQVYLGMASPAALEEWGQDYQFHQVGSGPFRFVDYVPNDHLTLVRNDDYAWAPSIFDHQGPAYLEEIEFRFLTDPAGRAIALEAGDVQVVGELPHLDADHLESSPDFQVIPVPIAGQSLGMMLNTQRPPLDDPELRRALLLATDRDTLVHTVFGQRSPIAYGPLTAATYGYDRSLESDDLYAPDQAEALLEELGWVDNDGTGIREQAGEELVLDAVLMSWGAVPEIGQLLQSQWRDVGVLLELQTLTYPAALEAARDGNYHLIPQNYSGTDPDLLWVYFHSGMPFNWSQVADSELDRLLDEGRSSLEAETRLVVYADAQQRIVDSTLLIPIRDPINLNGASASVKGLRFGAQGWFPLLHDVYLE